MSPLAYKALIEKFPVEQNGRAPVRPCVRLIVKKGAVKRLEIMLSVLRTFSRVNRPIIGKKELHESRLLVEPVCGDRRPLTRRGR